METKLTKGTDETQEAGLPVAKEDHHLDTHELHERVYINVVVWRYENIFFVR